MKRPRVLVAMSGGVDSSVAASLLVDQGYDVVGMTMQVWDYSSCDVEEGQGTCCSSIDVDDARSVAELLDFPFYVANCEAQFRDKVIDPFIDSYMRGETPSPCVNCNTFLKFDHLIRKMKELDCDFLATGHYAQIGKDDLGQPTVVTSDDGWKDQTYFLFTLAPEILPRLLFPVGDMTKTEVREYAESRGLMNARKKDSVGICFVGKQNYADFIDQQRPELKSSKEGDICRYPTGEVLGRHAGIHRYTVGQRKGLGLDHHETLYVVKVDSKENRVWVGDEKHLFSRSFAIENVNWLSPKEQCSESDIYNVKIRFHHKGAKARVLAREGQMWVEFEEPQRAVTPGQAAVFYRGSQLIGGGWVCKSQ